MYCILIFLLSFSITTLAQTLEFNTAGINAGLSFDVGSTTNRLGVYVGGFFFQDFIQINSTLRAYYNFSTYGPSLRGFEIQPSVGLLAAVGKRSEKSSEFFSSLGNQTGRKYSVGYAYNFYFDQIKTSQRTGTILIGVDKFELITENDIFATQRSDRFRTGAIKIGYAYEKMYFAITSVLWTGNPQSRETVKVRVSDFPSRFGYLDFSNAPFGKFSNGILAIQYKYALGLGQEVQASAGVDAEWVRNAIQNRLIHDMYFWPKKWNKARNPHLPMLDMEGNPYLYKQDQKLKPSSFYWDLSLNPSVFY